MKKTCNKCGVPKPLEAFYRKAMGKAGRKAICKECIKEHNRLPEQQELAAIRNARWWLNRGHDVRAQQRDRIRIKGRDYSKERRKQERAELLAIYGDRCVCCGEDNPAFLTLDHINRDGYADRKRCRTAFGFKRRILELGGRDPNIQLLCYNCNCGRERNAGVCPHENERVASLFQQIA
jgi:hypothetical protein